MVEHWSRKIGIEIKFSAAPKPARGFWQALQDLAIGQAFVVAPVARGYPLDERVRVVPVSGLAEVVEAVSA